MKKLLFIIPLSLSIAVMACSNGAEANTNHSENTSTQETSQQANIKKDVNVNEFAALIATGDGQIIDVRTPGEWAEGTMKDAHKINLYDADFKAQIEKLDKTKPIYVYCKVGGRSGQAATQMQTMGFTAVYNLTGGMNAWKGAGKDVVK